MSKSRVSACPWALAFVLLGLTSLPAHAVFSVCNKSGQKLQVAVAYVPKDAAGVSTSGHPATMVEGWWSFAPGECGQLFGFDAGAHWVSVYAENRTTGMELSGREPMFCVSGSRFEGQQRVGSPCKSGWRRVGFRRIDTEKKNHTFTIR